MREGRPRPPLCQFPPLTANQTLCRSCTGATAGGDDSGVRTAAGVVASTPLRMTTVQRSKALDHPPEVVIACRQPVRINGPNSGHLSDWRMGFRPYAAR